LKIYNGESHTSVGLSVLRGDIRILDFHLGIVVANYSLLPNAVIGARLSIQTKDGGWQHVENIRVEDGRFPMGPAFIHKRPGNATAKAG
jgi:hypothetical protein